VKLDYHPGKGFFTLHAYASEAARLKIEHGLDRSVQASTPQVSCLYTPEPYAAVAFINYATPAAARELNPIAREIAASWRYEPLSSSWPSYLCPDTETPYPLQLANIEYIERRQHALCADEPGIGKTGTANMWANKIAYEECRRPYDFRALAVVPASIRLQWAQQIRRWSTIPDVKISVCSSARRGIAHTRNEVHWTILSYEGASTRQAFEAIIEQQCNYDLAVFDEAHKLKTPSTGRTRAILGAADRASSISQRARHILALSGTPIPNRPREAYTLAKALSWEHIDFASERAFRERFNPVRARHNKYGSVVGSEEGVGRTHELQARLRQFMVRHLFHEAFPQLRLPVYDIIQAEKTGPVRQALEAEKLLDIDPETFQGADGKIDGAVSTARLMMGKAIAPQAVNYLKMLHEGGEDKILVFYWHREVGDILQKGLDKFGCARIDGSTSPGNIAKQLDWFINGNASFIVGQIMVLGTGHDGLQKASRRAVAAEPHWVLGDTEQAFRRLYRLGQTNEVLADILVAPDSLAEKVLATALRKGAIVHQALDKRV
jgi:SNF2 family DNA or RNA helicase